MRLLWIDDDEAVIKFGRGFLAPYGISVEAAGSAAAGIDRARGSRFGAIALDLHLPDADGIETFREIRSAGIVTPILILTGFPDPSSAFDAGTLGAIGYLQKPFAGRMFLQALVRLVPDAVATPPATNPPADTIHGTAKERIAAAIVRGMTSERDLCTVEVWARHVGAGAGTLKTWCATARIKPRRALVLLRLLRALERRNASGAALIDILEVADLRTAATLLALAGHPNGHVPDQMTLDHFVRTQLLVDDPVMIGHVRALLAKAVGSK